MQIKSLRREIAAHFQGVRVSRVKQATVGGGANLWKAVKIANNLNHETIPEKLTLNDIPVAPGTAAECFAGHL